MKLVTVLVTATAIFALSVGSAQAHPRHHHHHMRHHMHHHHMH